MVGITQAARCITEVLKAINVGHVNGFVMAVGRSHSKTGPALEEPVDEQREIEDEAFEHGSLRLSSVEWQRSVNRFAHTDRYSLRPTADYCTGYPQRCG